MAMGMMTEYYHFIFTTLVTYLLWNPNHPHNGGLRGEGWDAGEGWEQSWAEQPSRTSSSPSTIAVPSHVLCREDWA